MIWKQIGIKSRLRLKKQWKDLVAKAIEEKNTQKLISNCTTTTPQGINVNTKTTHIYNLLTTATHNRQPLKEILNQNKQTNKQTNHHLSAEWDVRVRKKLQGNDEGNLPRV